MAGAARARAAARERARIDLMNIIGVHNESEQVEDDNTAGCCVERIWGI
jgi:hypothetical protein